LTRLFLIQGGLLEYRQQRHGSVKDGFNMIQGRIPKLAFLQQRRGAAIAIGMLLIACLILWFACTDKEKIDKVSTVRVGILFPMTGYMADKGRDSADGAALAVEEINAAGGVRALGGAPLEIILSDTKGQPDIGMKAAERLIQNDNVVAMIGAYQSSVTKMATQIAEQFETPFIVSISIADIITERGFRYTFRLQPKAADYAREQVRFLSELARLADYPVKRVALLHENSDFGTSTALSQKKALRDFGMDLAVEVSYEAEGAKDLGQEVSLVLAAAPDVILEVTYLNDSMLIRRALAAADA
jgi:branched-chain amino acid transport system substrate-binding protein